MIKLIVIAAVFVVLVSRVQAAIPSVKASTTTTTTSSDTPEATTSSDASDPSTDDPQEGQTAFEKDPPFFLLEKDGKQSYLFGTVHIGSINLIPESIQGVLKQSRVLYVEQTGNLTKVLVDKINGLDDEIQAEKKEWFDKLNDEAVKTKIKKLMKRLNIKKGIENFISPKVLIFLYQYNPETQESPPSLEGNIMRLLKFKKDELKGLEKVEDTYIRAIKIIKAEDKDIVEFFKAEKMTKLKIQDTQQQNLAEYSQGWSNNLRYLRTMTRGPPNPETIATNKRWLPKIIKAHSEENKQGKIPLFVVGTEHLRGRDGGLIALLRKSGFTVRQVQIKVPYKDQFTYS